MQPETAKNNFESSIQQFDSLLRVRWGNVINQWVIERKGYVPPSEVEFLRRRQARFERWCNEQPDDAKRKALLVEITEEIQSAKDGRRIILYTKQLDRRVFDMLVHADIRRYGGYSRFADELERLEKQREDDANRAVENRMEDVNRMVADQMEFIERKRQTDFDHGKSWKEMLRSGTKPSESRNSDESFTVVDKRPVKPEEVGISNG